jgi:hypothetical protein
MATRKKQTHTFHYCKYDSKKKPSPPQPPTLLMQTSGNLCLQGTDDGPARVGWARERGKLGRSGFA